MYRDKVAITLSGKQKKRSTGWLAPLPDLRDYTEEHPAIFSLSKKLGFGKQHEPELPRSVDLREWCSEVEDQGRIGSCTAHAAVGIVEYFQRRSFGKHVEGSRLFVYKTTRNLMGVIGDTGSWLRTAMGALALCGLPPERYWPYTDEPADFDNDPGPFIYAIADKYEAIRYFCHDPLGQDRSKSATLQSVKTYLAAGIPSMLGFYGFSSFGQSDEPGKIPFPCPSEQAQWGHAVVAVGYDDNITIKNSVCNEETEGALLIRNSWGTAWGAEGYGWLPYEYVIQGVALDFWSLLSMEWVETSNFGLD